LALVNEDEHLYVACHYKALFNNLCCVLIVESLNGDQLYIDQ